MDWNTANTEATKLWYKWVSSRPAVGIDGYLQQSRDMADYKLYDLDRIHSSMLQEYRYIRQGTSRATPGLISEVKGELILLGKIRKALAKDTDAGSRPRCNIGSIELCQCTFLPQNPLI